MEFIQFRITKDNWYKPWKSITKVDKKRSVRRIDVYDPRIQNRKFKLQGKCDWNSEREGVVVFDSTSYGSFTDTAWLRRLLQVLVNGTRAKQVAVKAADLESTMEGMEIHRTTDASPVFLLEVEGLDTILDLFNRNANYGIWTFYGLEFAPDKITLDELPDILTHSRDFVFFVQLDLDGMLIGYVYPGQDPSKTVADLEALN